MVNNFQFNEVRKNIEQHLIFSCADDYEDHWMVALSKRINELIQHDFARLVNILYQLDINESGLGQLLQKHPGTDAGKIIGELIIERQLEKIRSGRFFDRMTARLTRTKNGNIKSKMGKLAAEN